MSDTGIYPSAKNFAERERIGARADAILKEMVDEAFADESKLSQALRDMDADDLLIAMMVAALRQNSIGALHNQIEGQLRFMWLNKAQRQAEGGG